MNKKLADTSLEAYASLNETASEKLRQRILSLLTVAPMTDEEIFDALGGDAYYSPSGARARRKELEARGDVIDSGLRKRTQRKRNAKIWKLAKPHQQMELF